MPTSSNQEIRELKLEMQHLAELIEEKIKDAANNNGNVIGFSQRDLRRAAKRVGANVREFLAAKTKQAEELRDAAEDTITHHPFKSVAAAVAGGLLLGALLRR